MMATSSSELTEARRIASIAYQLLDVEAQRGLAAMFPLALSWLGGDLDMSASEQFVSTKQAAQLLGVTEGTVRNWASDGILQRAGRVGRETHYRREDVERLAGRVSRAA